jgi:single-strand DNA-binding protein
MAGETTLTVVGNLTADPELRFTPSGSAVANFTIASTPRIFKDGEYKDGDTLFMRVAVWKEQAENVAESLTKGNRVVVTGRLKQRSYETKEGEKRTIMEMEADEVAPSLRYASAKVERKQKSEGWTKQPARNDDPWGGSTGDSSGWGNGPDSEPPF